MGSAGNTWIETLLTTAGAALACLGFFLVEWTHRHAIPSAAIGPDVGHGYVVADLASKSGAGLPPGDANDHPQRSTLVLEEDGQALAPGHAIHEDIRSVGKGRHSHWGTDLYFSASDNSDPRSNGRRYAISYVVPIADWLRLLAMGSGLALVLFAQRRGLVQEGHELVHAMRALAARVRHPLRDWPWVHLALLATMVLLVVFPGLERSGWILVTQPLEALHRANSLLGFSFLMDGFAVHKENLSAFGQVALFSGFEAWPDLYFRRPVYTFIATLLSPAFGVAGSLFLVNLGAWVVAVWLCHRFASRVYEDPRAGWWAALLASVGIGFVLHARDLSAHLLSFTFYMGGVVLIYESDAWRRKVDLRKHLAIGLYLAVACLQYNTGVALVAAYAVVCLRHQPFAVAAAALAALAAQPAWGWVIGEVHRLQTGLPLPDLSTTERQYLHSALTRWRVVLEQSPAESLAWIAGLVGSFLSFEAPLVVLGGLLNLLADFRRGQPGRTRLMFAAPFILLPFLAALVFAPTAAARGYLVYGVAIFFFAACGAGIAAAGRKRPGGIALGIVVLIGSLAWSTAHFVNVMGPAKSYFLGMQQGQHLFKPGGWRAVSLTGNEPTPRLFGGPARLKDAGLTQLPLTPRPKYLGPAQAFRASVLLAVIGGVLLVAAAGLGWRTALVFASLLVAIPTSSGRWVDHRNAYWSPDRVDPIEPGANLTYQVDMSGEVTAKFLDGVRAGHVVVLFAANHTGAAPPTVEVGDRAIRLVRKVDSSIWLLDTKDLAAALGSSQGTQLAVGFPGGNDSFVGGWQRTDLPGRRVPGRAMPALPSVELRLLRDAESATPLLIAF